MCQVTNNLKLCSCETDIDELKDYWVYNRREEDKMQQILGLALFPMGLDKAISTNNKKRITRMLNQGNCFDFEVKPLDGDQLHLFFDTSGLDWHALVYYSFRFKNGKWQSFETEPLLMEEEHQTLFQGEIKNGLSRPIQNDDLKLQLGAN